MAINLIKGQRVEIESSLSRLVVEMGWKVNPNAEPPYDLDASIFLLGNSGQIEHEADFVFYGSSNRIPALDEHGNQLYDRDGNPITRPISLDKSTLGSIDDIGEDEDDPVFSISDILPHLAQEQMKSIASEFIKGEDLDLIIGSKIPESKDDETHNKDEKCEKKENPIFTLLKEKYNIEKDDFNSAELEVVPAGKARDLGLDRSLILAYGQDDRSCAFTSVQAIFDAKPSERTQCCLCVDKEEIGSVGATGMASNLFENMIAEVIAKAEPAYSELILRRCLSNSNMLSSDVNAAYDPLNSGLYDKDNASVLGGGITFQKYTGARGKSGASDANPEFIAKVRAAMDENKVRYQMAELGKVDQGGGGTIAYHAAKYGMNVLDAGVAVLSMHAPWEITSKEDIIQAYNGNKAFLGIK